MATQQAKVSIKGTSKVTTTKPVKKSTVKSLEQIDTPIFNQVFAEAPLAVKAAVRTALTGNKK